MPNRFTSTPLRCFLTGCATPFVLSYGIHFLKLLVKLVQQLEYSKKKRDEIAKEKREKLDLDLFEAEKFAGGLAAHLRKDINNCETISELIKMQKSGECSAIQILQCFLYNVIAAHQKTNCVVALPWREAVKAAEECDRLRSEEGKVFPLHGIPVSIKDSTSVKGLDSTMGMVSRANQPETDDAAPVAALRRAGAVIICKTNIPQTLLSYESHNELFGACKNPIDARHTSGGSSGGEGALIALKGAMLGLGSDIGGSIRIPSHFCGVYGLKPTQYRVPNRRVRTSVPGQEGVSAVIGPMARNVEDLALGFEVLVSHHEQVADGNVLHVPFRPEMLKEANVTQRNGGRKLKVGFYVDDGFVKSTPACQRAVRLAVDALRRDGHEVVEWQPPNAVCAMKTFYQLLSADGGKSVQKCLGNESPTYHIAPTLRLATTPVFLKKLVAYFLSWKDKRLASIIGDLKEVNVHEYYQLLEQRNELRHLFAESFEKEGLDFIIAPGLIFPAPLLDATIDVSFGSAYTAIYNLLDCCSVAVPVTRVDPSVDQMPLSMGHQQQDNCENAMMLAKVEKCYVPAKGLPVGVQLVTPRLTEEKALGYAGLLTQVLRQR